MHNMHKHSRISTLEGIIFFWWNIFSPYGNYFLKSTLWSFFLVRTMMWSSETHIYLKRRYKRRETISWIGAKISKSIFFYFHNFNNNRHTILIFALKCFSLSSKVHVQNTHSQPSDSFLSVIMWAHTQSDPMRPPSSMQRMKSSH